MARVLPADLAGSDPLVRRSEHADFQSNIALAVAKQAGRPPRELAADLAAAIDQDTVSATVSGPGFLNLHLRDTAIWRGLAGRLGNARLGIGTPLVDERVVIDYSAPNVAKEMHVGHLRTTIIGDALARVLDFLGAQVVRQNHLGDWGTQFGMLIQYLDEHPELPWRQQDTHVETASAVSALDALYRAARQQFDADPQFADRARSRVVALQAGDPATLALCRDLVADSYHSFQSIYDRLGVLLTPADSAGESTYNPYLTEVVDELVAAGIAVESNGALCVFFDDITGPEGHPHSLRRRRPPSPALPHDLRHREAGRMAHRRRPRRTRAVRHCAWTRRTAVQDPLRWHGSAQRPSRRCGGPGSRGRLGEESRTRPGSTRSCRTGRWHRCGQVRRPVHLSYQGLHLRRRPYGLPEREHRRLPPVRPRPHPVHPPQTAQ